MTSSRSGWRKTKLWLLGGAAILFVVLANAHLVYVALISQPSCVAHARLGDGGDGRFSAAKSSCSPN